MKRIFSISEFHQKFGVSVPLYIKRVWSETIAERWWWGLWTQHKNVTSEGDVLMATAVEVSDSADGGEFEVRGIYKKAPSLWHHLVVPIGSPWTILTRSENEWTIRFSDNNIRERLEAELGKLPPPRGNYVCGSCAMDTGDQDWCSACGSQSYWAAGGGGCRLSCEMVLEWFPPAN